MREEDNRKVANLNVEGENDRIMYIANSTIKLGSRILNLREKICYEEIK